MKKAIADKWIAALRSGKYKRGIGQLRDENNKFCCLGVLCNIHAQEHPKIAAQQENSIEYMYHMSYLPPQVQNWAGMKTEDGMVPEKLGVRINGTKLEDLASMNDYNMSFNKLANFIEKNWKAL